MEHLMTSCHKGINVIERLSSIPGMKSGQITLISCSGLCEGTFYVFLSCRNSLFCLKFGEFSTREKKIIWARYFISDLNIFVHGNTRELNATSCMIFKNGLSVDVGLPTPERFHPTKSIKIKKPTRNSFWPILEVILVISNPPVIS